MREAFATVATQVAAVMHLRRASQSDWIFAGETNVKIRQPLVPRVAIPSRTLRAKRLLATLSSASNLIQNA